MVIEKAAYEDLKDILQLQKLAYQSEAQILNDFSIPPLLQTLEEVHEEFTQGIILKYVEQDNFAIVGSVRASSKGERVKVGKLMVHPDCQNKGIGSKLLKEIEKYYPNKSYELFTSSKSTKNISLYKKHGYQEFARELIKPGLQTILMRKDKI